VPLRIATARGAPGEQDRFRERPMNWRFETLDRFLAHNLCHQISAPPPNEKKDRKKDDAAKAIDRPNTIWMRRKAASGIAEGERQTGHDDDDHRDDVRHRPLDRLKDLLERLFPRHVGARCKRRGSRPQQTGDHDGHDFGAGTGRPQHYERPLDRRREDIVPATLLPARRRGNSLSVRAG